MRLFAILAAILSGLCLSSCSYEKVHRGEPHETLIYAPGEHPWVIAHPYPKTTSYYYYPASEVYERIGGPDWYWHRGEVWMRGRDLPKDMRYENLGTRVVVDLVGAGPADYHEEVAELYPAPIKDNKPKELRRYDYDHEFNRLRDMDLTRDRRHLQGDYDLAQDSFRYEKVQSRVMLPPRDTVDMTIPRQYRKAYYWP